MKTLLSIVVAALIAPAAATPGRADVVPDRPYSKRTPPLLRVVVERFSAALGRGDTDAARAQCDPRGWDTNLVGGSGEALSAFVAQGIRKRFYPRVEAGAWRRVGKVVVMTADIVQVDDGRVSDRVELVLVEEKPFGRWFILGAGEDAAEVQALAERAHNGWPLAPAKAP